MDDKKILLEGTLLEDIDCSWIKVFESDCVEKWIGINHSSMLGTFIRIDEVKKEDTPQETSQRPSAEGYDGDEIDVWGY
jgi:hypothetical protein